MADVALCVATVTPLQEGLLTAAGRATKMWRKNMGSILCFSKRFTFSFHIALNEKRCFLEEDVSSHHNK